MGAGRTSRAFEWEADAPGTEIELFAGFDPVLGAGFFDRLPDPGEQPLGSHPPNAQHKAQVRAVVAQLRGVRAARLIWVKAGAGSRAQGGPGGRRIP